MEQIEKRLSLVEADSRDNKKAHEYLDEYVKEIKTDVKSIDSSLRELPSILKEMTAIRKEHQDSVQRIWERIEKDGKENKDYILEVDNKFKEFETKIKWLPLYDKIVWTVMSAIGTSGGLGIGWLIYNAIIHWGK